MLLHDSGEDGSCPIDTVLIVATPTRPTASHLHVYLTTLVFDFNRNWLDLKKNIEKPRAEAKSNSRHPCTHVTLHLFCPAVSLAWRGRDGSTKPKEAILTAD